MSKVVILCLLSIVSASNENSCKVDEASLIQKEALLKKVEENPNFPSGHTDWTSSQKAIDQEGVPESEKLQIIPGSPEEHMMKESFHGEDDITAHVMEVIRNTVDDGKAKQQDMMVKGIATQEKNKDDYLRLQRKMDAAKSHGIHSQEAGAAMHSIHGVLHDETSKAAAVGVQKYQMIKQATEDPEINSDVERAVRKVAAFNYTDLDHEATDFLYMFNKSKMDKVDLPEYVEENDWTFASRPEATSGQMARGTIKDFAAATKEYNDEKYGEDEGLDVKEVLGDELDSKEEVAAKEQEELRRQQVREKREEHFKEVTLSLDEVISEAGGNPELPAYKDQDDLDEDQLEKFHEEQDDLKAKEMAEIAANSQISLEASAEELGLDVDAGMEESATAESDEMDIDDYMKQAGGN